MNAPKFSIHKLVLMLDNPITNYVSHRSEAFCASVTVKQIFKKIPQFSSSNLKSLKLPSSSTKPNSLSPKFSVLFCPRSLMPSSRRSESKALGPGQRQISQESRSESAYYLLCPKQKKVTEEAMSNWSKNKPIGRMSS